jgi:hypothetical protein
MARIPRGSRAYQYRTIRRGGKVIGRYEASIPAADVVLIRSLVAEGRSLRAMGRAAWDEQRGLLADAERHAIEAEAAYDGLATAALVAAGYHRPERDKWRRRRTMANNAGVKVRPGFGRFGRPKKGPLRRTPGGRKFPTFRRPRNATSPARRSPRRAGNATNATPKTARDGPGGRPRRGTKWEE